VELIIQKNTFINIAKLRPLLSGNVTQISLIITSFTHSKVYLMLFGYYNKKFQQEINFLIQIDVIFTSGR
jgi:hypothetical protein